MTIGNITSDNLTAKESIKSEKSIKGNDGTINNDLVVNNNLSVKNNLKVANSLTTKNITNSNNIETNKITTQNVIFKFSDYSFNIVKVKIIIRDIPNSTIANDIFLLFDGLAIMNNNYKNRLQFINCHGVSCNNCTGATRLTVAYNTNTNLSIGLLKPGESNYTTTELNYIVGIYYSNSDVNTIYQTRYAACYGNKSHLWRDSDVEAIFPCKGSIIQFTCAQCYSHQDI